MKNNTIYSGLLRRSIALLIDVVIVTTITLILFGVSTIGLRAGIQWVNGGFLVSYSSINSMYIGYVVLIWMVYALILEFVCSATIGSLIVGQKVSDFMKQKPSIIRLITKHILKPVDIVCGPIIFLFSKTNQSLGDRASGIIVVKRKSIGEPIIEVPVHWFRKVLGVAYSIVLIVCIVASAYFIPKILAQRTFIFETLTNAQTQLKDLDPQPLYDSFSDQFRQEITIEKFVGILNESKLHLMIQDLVIDKTVVKNWYFKGSDYAEVALTDGKWIVAIITHISDEGDISFNKLYMETIEK